ncbi:hypothetical protein D3C73_1201540 [compost metagenome]
MDFIINHVRQFDHVHDANRDLALKTLAGTAVIKHSFTIALHACFFHCIEYVIFICTIEYRCSNMNT